MERLCFWPLSLKDKGSLPLALTIGSGGHIKWVVDMRLREQFERVGIIIPS